jgi:hypothetical protein
MAGPTSNGLVTLDMIQNVLQNELRPKRQDVTLPPFACEEFYAAKRVGNRFKYYSAEERKQIIEGKCQQLFEATADPEDHLRGLDQSFAALIECNFVIESKDLKVIIAQAHGVLARLPPRPITLPDLPATLPGGFCITAAPGSADHGTTSTVWDDLLVVSTLNSNIIRSVLLAIIYGYGYVSLLRDVINSTGEMLEACTILTRHCAQEKDLQRWFVVRAFLWTSWQRSFTVLAYFRMGINLKLGYNHDDGKDNSILGFCPAPNITIQDLTDELSLEGRAKAMCTWAFKLLTSEPACFGLDFRHFHYRYSQIVREKAPRCNLDSDEPCDGQHSDSCRRFKGLKVVSQSAHDRMCTWQDELNETIGARASFFAAICCRKPRNRQELKLIWDEKSYRSVNGARAVSLAETDPENGPIKFCKASHKTLAISHVWSHGQGGRPETGINRCLHARYARIARNLECDSYWIDTTCIPCEHELRKEAINHINGVFAESRTTIICDRDLMDIDVSGLTLATKESILAAILVCDWNIRAWTFLEAMKARQAIRILCKNDETMSLRDLIQDVYDHGRIDLVVLCQLAPHLLPVAAYGIPRSNVAIKNNLGDMPIEVGGTLLSYRPASRPGDDIVIWSLIIDPLKPSYDAEHFWRSRIGGAVSTGFLVSSAARLRSRGLSWAPATPYAAPRAHGKGQSGTFYRAFDGIETELGSITEVGIFGTWLVYEFDSPLLATNFKHYLNIGSTRRSANQPSSQIGQRSSFIDEEHSSRRGSEQSPLIQNEPSTSLSDKQFLELDRIRSRFLRTCRFGALLQPARVPGVYWRPGLDAARYLGKVRGTLLVVCGCFGGSTATTRQGWIVDKWIWKGLYVWPKEVPLPTFEKQEGFCIA